LGIVNSSTHHAEFAMPSTARPNRINIDLQAYKQPWLDYCEARGVTPSEAFRQVVAKLTAADAAGEPGKELAKDERQKVRREVRLTKSELAHANALAARDGFSLNRWIVALINARLHGTPQLGQHELEALGRSNLHLHAIGRNLNQLARAANRGVSIQGHGRGDVIEALRAVVKDHTAQVARVMAANVARWQL
jgi:hypothetical protein